MSKDSDLKEGITRLTATELAKKIRDRELSSVEVVEAHIERIKEVNPSLNAVIVPLFDEALAQAKEADRLLEEGGPVGPLHGVPITIKEQFDVAGTETNVGVPNNRGIVAEKDGPLVARLRDAGAIILGKTNVAMTLAAWESDNPVYGRTNNPWDLERTPGGSSGGESAIIAARGSPLGLGGDFGGSIRLPAHFTGLHGIKPTSHRLTNTDTPGRLFSSGQEVIIPQPGPIARSVEDLKLMMKVLADPPMERTPDLVPPVPWPDPDEVSVKGLRVAYYTNNGVYPVSPAIRRAVQESVELLEAKGAVVEPFSPPDAEEAFLMYFEVNAAGGNESIPRTLAGSKPNYLVEGFVQGLTAPGPIMGLVTWNMERSGQRRMASLARSLKKLSGEGYWKLIERLNIYREKFYTALDEGGFDAIICPPYATVAPPHGYTLNLTPAASSYGLLYNLLGMPAGVVSVTTVQEGEEHDETRPSSTDPADLAAVDVEKGSAGLPVSVQVVARHWREDIVLAVMEALEEHFKDSPSYPLNQTPVVS
jgi:fatty acid amide hydrolase